MDRSSHQSQRSDRISNSPYRRPAQGHKKSTSGSFASVKSFLSYLSPFRSSSELSLPTTISDLPIEIEEGSHSGSEDGWNGEAPTTMNSADVFDLAAAAGRGGNDFERRTAEFRARGEIPGGRRDLARRSLEGLPAPIPAAPLISSTAVTTTPASSRRIHQTSTTTIPNGRPSAPPKRARSPEVFTPQRNVVPAPAFLPAATTGNSASSAALTAFLEAKKGQQMSQEDLDVIDSLTRNIHAESQGGFDGQYGGWSAGMSPRVTRSIPGQNGTIETPPRNTLTTPFNTPGSVFSVGTVTPGGTPNKASPYRVRYLGPGMSPKRMLGKGQSSGGLKPLFQFNIDNDESAQKKRRVDAGEAMDVDEIPAPKATISSVASMPNLASYADSPASKGKSKAAPRPHPLSQSVIASPVETRPTAEEIGKKRAADIMLEMIQQQTATLPKPQSNIIINPYDSPAAVAPSPSTPASKRVVDGPRQSALRATGRGETPLRGAAAKLANHKSSSKGSESSTPVPASKSSPAPAKQVEKTVEVETPVEAVSRSTAPSPPSTAGNKQDKETPSAGSKAPEPEPFKAFEIPTFSRPSQGATTFTSPASAKETFDSPSQKLALSAAKETTEQPKFAASPLKPITQVEDEPVTAAKSFTATKKDTLDPTKIYFTAKESALKIADAALPFYTFTIPSKTAKNQLSEAVKEQALKATLPTFTFTLPTPPSTTSNTFKWPTAAAKAPGAEWTCDTCMLKNPDSAKEKCTICEAARPGQKPVAPVASTPFQWPGGNKAAVPSGQWTCNTCMLTNPDSAKDSCMICDAARPGQQAISAPAPAPTAAPVSTPFQWPSGSAPVKAKDEWTCPLCGLQNKLGSAKCKICEEPKP